LPDGSPFLGVGFCRVEARLGCLFSRAGKIGDFLYFHQFKPIV
jgi:hypothetical protein